MYGNKVRRNALALMAIGCSLRSISMSTGINRVTLREWRENPARRASLRAECPRCADRAMLPQPHADCAYLLGRYLGDGGSKPCGRDGQGGVEAPHYGRGLVARVSSGSASGPRARSGPATKSALRRSRAAPRICGCSRHWPCLFPQHGAGQKHLRTIGRQPWQRVIVRAYPGQLARGLFHADGYRGINRVQGISRMATGMSIHGICLPMSHGTFSGSVGPMHRRGPAGAPTRPGQEGSGMG